MRINRQVLFILAGIGMGHILAPFVLAMADTIHAGFTLFTDEAPTLSGQAGVHELGMELQAITSGKIVGIKHYKMASDLPPHVGTIWQNGNVLSSVVFSSEKTTDEGWQEATFNAPIFLNAGDKVVMSVNHNPETNSPSISPRFPAKVSVFTGIPVSNGGLSALRSRLGIALGQEPNIGWTAWYYTDVRWLPIDPVNGQ